MSKDKSVYYEYEPSELKGKKYKDLIKKLEADWDKQISDKEDEDNG